MCMLQCLFAVPLWFVAYLRQCKNTPIWNCDAEIIALDNVLSHFTNSSRSDIISMIVHTLDDFLSFFKKWKSTRLWIFCI